MLVLLASASVVLTIKYIKATVHLAGFHYKNQSHHQASYKTPSELCCPLHSWPTDSGNIIIPCVKWSCDLQHQVINPCKSVRRFCHLDVCLSMHRCIWVEKKNQLDANEWFIALIICSTCFGHFYAHHQELKTICVLLPPMVCDALVAGCWRSGAGQLAALHLTPDYQQPSTAHHRR